MNTFRLGLVFLVFALALGSTFLAPTPSIAPAAFAKTQAGGDDFDLDGLIERVSKTKAIGFLTKLSLKRDIDKFESDLKAYHAKRDISTLDELKERYNLMVNNLLVMVQKDDGKLAEEITSARERLWATLADPDAFSKI